MHFTGRNTLAGVRMQNGEDEILKIFGKVFEHAVVVEKAIARKLAGVGEAEEGVRMRATGKMKSNNLAMFSCIIV